MRRLPGAGALLTLCLALVVGAAPAVAHAELVSSTPHPGQRVSTPPDHVVLRFTEPVTLVRDGIRLLDGAGRPAPVGAPRRVGREVHVPLSELADGAYVLTWRVVSADSHPVAGAVAFAIGAAEPADAPAVAEAPSGAPLLTRSVFTLVRWAGFVGLVLLLGAVAFTLLCWPSGASDPLLRRVMLTGAATLAAATVTAILVQGVYTTGTPLLEAADPTLVGETLRTPFGLLAAVRLALVAAATAALPRLLGRRSAPVVAALVTLAAALLLTFAASGHAVAAPQPALALSSDVLHLAAMATWLGGLVVLTLRVLPAHDGEDLREVMPAFSRVAFSSVCVLAVTGTYRSWSELGVPAALTSTTYGRLLLAKLAAVAVLLALGNLGRNWVHARYPVTVVHATGGVGPGARLAPADESAATDVQRLRHSVAAEVVLAAVVLAITAALVATPPARTSVNGVSPPTAADDARASVSKAAVLTLPDGNQVHLTVDPARLGPNTVELHVTTTSGRSVDATEVTATTSLRERGIERLPVPLHRVAAGHYVARRAQLPFAGSWRFDVKVRTSEIDAFVGEAAVTIHEDH